MHWTQDPANKGKLQALRAKGERTKRQRKRAATLARSSPREHSSTASKPFADTALDKAHKREHQAEAQNGKAQLKPILSSLRARRDALSTTIATLEGLYRG